MKGHKITGIGIKIKESILSVQLHDTSPEEGKEEEQKPFAKFNIDKDSYLALIQALICMGYDIEKKVGIDLKMPPVKFEGNSKDSNEIEDKE